MQRTRIYLVRHGQVEGYQQKRYNGQINVPLTELGKEQSELICACLANIALDAIYSSDLDRSRYCARLIADGHGLVVVEEQALREINFGDWEGRTWVELQESYPDDWQKRLQDLTNYQVPGGESLQDAADRIRPVIRRILEKHPNGDIALVAHGMDDAEAFLLRLVSALARRTDWPGIHRTPRRKSPESAQRLLCHH